MGKKWLPLESNPDVLNDFTAALGLDVSKHSFHDVFGLDEVSDDFAQPCITDVPDLRRVMPEGSNQ